MLDQDHRLRDRALFDLAIDSKLRGCDLVKIRIGDLVAGARVRNRAMVIQQKTKRPVQFELLEPAQSSILAWLERRQGSIEEFAFPSRIDRLGHLSTRQYARLVDDRTLGEEPAAVVHLAPGSSASEEDLRDWVRARLAGFKVPVRILFATGMLPRNANGKILKKNLKTLFETAH